MDKSLLTYFWNCGDDQIIQFAMQRAHLNRREREVICMTLDECMTQEEIAERICYSPRRVQQFWTSGVIKLLSIPWLVAYAKELKNRSSN